MKGHVINQLLFVTYNVQQSIRNFVVLSYGIYIQYERTAGLQGLLFIFFSTNLLGFEVYR